MKTYVLIALGVAVLLTGCSKRTTTIETRSESGARLEKSVKSEDKSVAQRAGDAAHGARRKADALKKAEDQKVQEANDAMKD